jgi:hypothetical protein
MSRRNVVWRVKKELIWLRTETSAEIFCTCYETSWFHEMLLIYYLAEQLLASESRLCCMEPFPVGRDVLASRETSPCSAHSNEFPGPSLCLFVKIIGSSLLL